MNFFEKLKNKFMSKSKSGKTTDTNNNEETFSIDNSENTVCDTTTTSEIVENKVVVNNEQDFSIDNIEKNVDSEQSDEVVEAETISNQEIENSSDSNNNESTLSVDNEDKTASSALASEIIKNKLLSCGGTATIYGLNNGEYVFSICNDGKSFSSPSLPNHPYDFTVFDIIVNLLESKGGKAKKGVGRGKGIRLGDAGCEVDTVVGVIAKEYWGKNIGDSVLDPVFIMAAILEWAEICNNKRGYIEIKK